MRYRTNPHRMLKQHDYALTASSWLLLAGCSTAGMLPRYISSGVPYTIEWTALGIGQSEAAGFVSNIQVIKNIRAAIIELMSAWMPQPLEKQIDIEFPDNSYFGDQKDKPIASSYLFATAKNLLAAGADYYYLRRASSMPIGVLAVFGARFTFEFMQRVFDRYQYEGKDQAGNFTQIAQRGALRALAGTAVHLCIMTMIHDQQHLVSKIAIIPYIYVLKLCAEYFANSILNTNEATAELCTQAR